MEPTFGARLKSWLKFRNMSAAALARGFADETTRTAVHNWLHDYASPGANRIAPICAIIGVSVAEFFARMPDEEAPDVLPDEELPPHPFTNEVTREVPFSELAAGRVDDEACPQCGRKGEAA